MDKISVLGVDLGKSVIHVHGVDPRGRQVLAKRFTRTKFREFLLRLPPAFSSISPKLPYF